MKKSRKIALIVLASLSALFTCGFIALFFTSQFAVGTAEQVSQFNNECLNLIKELFILPFSKPTEVPGLIGYYGEQNALILSISALVLVGIIFITLVLGIVFVCVKKKPVMIIFAPVLLLAGFAGLAMLACGQIYFGLIQLALQSEPALPGYAVLLIVLVAFAGLGFILTYVTYILGLCSLKAKKAEAVEEAAEEELAPVAEETKDPEIVEEGEELVFAAPVAEETPLVEVEPVEEKEPEPLPEDVEVEEEKPAEEEAKVEPEPAKVEVNVTNGAGGLDQNSLATLLREVVRDIVRDEIARNNANQPQQPQQSPAGNQTITGATFGGPLVVQYFNGGINGVNPPSPVPAPAPAAEPAPAPAPAPVEEKKPEPAKPAEPVKKEPAPAPAVEVKPAAPLFTKKEVAEGEPETPKYERLSFAERLLKSDKDIQDLYNELKNEILSYGVKSRISAVGDTFRLHKKMYVRITVAGKSLKLYFALNPADYAGTTLPIQDASGKEMYAEIPLVFKVKSGLSVRRCKELIQDVMDKDGLEQGEVGKVNWIKELKAELASGSKKEKEED